MKATRLFLIVCFLFSFALTAYAGPHFTAVKLDGSNVTGGALNDSGVVVGTYENGNGDYRAFAWSAESGIHDLGVLAGYVSSAAEDINNNGVIVGESYQAGMTETAAFVFTAANGMQNLGNLGGTFTRAEGINEAGQVVGESSLAAGNDAASHAFIWTEAGGMVDMVGNAFGDYNSSSYAINDSGVATLYKHTVDDQGMISTRTAYIWDSSNGPQYLGPFPKDQSESLDINSNSKVVGYYNEPMSMGRTAYSWTEADGIVSLPQPSSVTSATAAAVNDNGIIVGYGNDDAFNSYPLLWVGNTVFNLNDVTDLQDGWILQFAYDINSSGQIVCTGLVDGVTATFLLTPDAKVVSRQVV